MITLYVKTHRVTGLKYFGKTTSDNPNRYRGSGKHWLRHLVKHGNDVETEIVGVFEDANEASEFALKFSHDHNIVKSPEWANLKEENALEGHPKGIVFSDEWIESLRQGQLKRGPIPQQTKDKLSKILKGKKRSLEARENMSKSKLGKHYPKLSEAKKGIKQSPEHIQKKADALRGKKRPEHALVMSKKWLITDPDRKTHIVIGLNNFCEEHGLCPSAMIGVAKGKKLHHHGYFCEEIK